MSSSDSLDRALSENVSPTEAIQGGIAGIILAIAGGIILVIDEAAEGFAQILNVFDAVREFFVAMYQNPANILEAGAEATADALDGFGVEGFAVAVGSIAMGFIVWSLLSPRLPLVDRYLPWRNSGRQ